AGLVEDVQVGLAAEILQQQEALREVAREHRRHAQAAGLQQVVDLQPRTHVHEPGRCVHQHQAGLASGGAPVAAEIGVERGALESGVRLAERATYPFNALPGALAGRGVGWGHGFSGRRWPAGKRETAAHFRARESMKLQPVLLSGRAGTRLWRLSRDAYPKQFLPVAGEHTMLQDAWLRVAPLAASAPIVVANEEHRFLAGEQLRLVGVEHADIVLEPVGRNTAPAIAAAALQATAGGDDPVLLVLP